MPNCECTGPEAKNLNAINEMPYDSVAHQNVGMSLKSALAATPGAVTADRDDMAVVAVAAEWGDVFGDAVVGTAILDKLLHQVWRSVRRSC